MNKNSNSNGRIVGLDSHPDSFTAALLVGATPAAAVVEKMFNHVPITRLPSWAKKHTSTKDLFVLEASGNSFQVVRSLAAIGRNALVLESCHLGKLKTAHANNDKISAVRIGKAYLAGTAKTVWVPDPKTQERRDFFHAHQKAVRRLTQVRNRLRSYLSDNGVRLTGPKTDPTEPQLRRLGDWSPSQWRVIQGLLLELRHARKSVVYQPNANTYGTDSLIYSVTDGVSTNSAYVTVKVRAGPVIAIQDPPDGGTYPASSNISISGATFGYDISITNIALYINGGLFSQFAPTNVNYLATPTNFFFGVDAGAISPQTTYSFFSTNWSTNVPGFYSIVAIGIDAYGHTNSSASFTPVTVVVTNTSTATNVITAAISNLNATVAFETGDLVYPVIRQGLFDLQGLAEDPITNEPVAYQVLVHPPGNLDVVIANVTPQPRNANGFHQGRDNGGDLGTNDFTEIPNGIYDLELIVDGGGSQTNAVARFSLDTQLKIGQFSFSQQDMVIPASGIPITIMRTYNSLNPDSGDFGYSWTFAINSMDVVLDEDRTDVTIGGDSAPYSDGDSGNGLPQVVSIRKDGGRNVTLTLPNGRRTTFIFNPDQTSYYDLARWTAPPDVHATLTSMGNAEIDFITGLFWKDGGDNSTYDTYDVPGWVLQTQDGTQYNITRGPGTSVVYDISGEGDFRNVQAYGAPILTSIVQRTGDTLAIATNGIFHYPSNSVVANRVVLFNRDGQGRITAIYDPVAGTNGFPSLQYIYNQTTGNLLQVLKLTDRVAGTYTTNKYDYDYAQFPHYITSIQNADGTPVARNEYDDSGRLVELVPILKPLAAENKQRFFGAGGRFD